MSDLRFQTLRAFAFDAYGTLFDVLSVTWLCEELFPGRGAALAQLWRLKQLQYSVWRSLMGRHRDFWHLTEDGLVYACRSLGLTLTADTRTRLLEAYLTLRAFPDVKPAGMCPYRDTWVISQNASAALKYMSGVGAEPRPPRLGPSSDANVM